MVSAISNPASFHAEARFQRVCIYCERGGAFHAHHAVSKHWLKKNGRVDLLHDPRNAIRLCESVDPPHCHHDFEGHRLLVPTEKLPPDAICFIFEVMGLAGQNLLEREYTGVDRRYTLHLEGRCPLCQ